MPKIYSRKMSRKGQVKIPKELWNQLEISESNQYINLVQKEDHIQLMPFKGLPKTEEISEE